MRLGIGTAQFGANYGISNKNGQVSEDEIEKILNLARKNKIDTIDTASLYGNCEEILGKFNLDGFKIVTKTAKSDNSLNNQENIRNFENTFYHSLEKLNVDNIYGLLFHEADDLGASFSDSLYKKIENFKKQNLIKKLGVSLYSPSQLINIINKYDIDMVQFPLNLSDWRFVPLLKELKKKNIEIHVRSIFLQGLLLMDLCDIPSYFDEIKPVLGQLPEDKLKATLSFPFSFNEIDRIIIGITKSSELEEILNKLKIKDIKIDYNKFKIDNEKYINPSNWRI